MKAVALTNRKGGVGKTTTAVNLAQALIRAGKRVLLIDVDSQGNSTSTYGALIEGQCTLYDVLSNDDPLIEAIQHTKNGDIVAGDPLLDVLHKNIRVTNEEAGLSGTETDPSLISHKISVALVSKLKKKLVTVKDMYDYVIMDTPPSRSLLTETALTAADSCIIPMEADDYTVSGLGQLLSDTVKSIKANSNPNLKVEGLLFCRFARNTNIYKDYYNATADLAPKLGTKVYEATIRTCKDVQEAKPHRKMLHEYAPDCTTSLDYEWFAGEFLYDNEGFLASVYGLKLLAKQHQKENGVFTYADEKDRAGFSFTRNGMEVSFYTVAKGGIFAECKTENNTQIFTVANAESFKKCIPCEEEEGGRLRQVVKKAIQRKKAAHEMSASLSVFEYVMN